MVKYWSSKSTSGVRFPPTSMLSLKDFSKIIFSLFFVLIFHVNDTFTGNVFAQKLLLGLAVGFAGYWLVSIFIFIFKRSLYTSYTVVIQRYWKRSLYLFWIIELFLFAIYIYLILVAPTEVEWLLDQPQLFKSNYWEGIIFFNKLLVCLAIIIGTVIAQYLLVNQNKMFLTISVMFVTILVMIIAFSDFAQTYMYSIYFAGLNWTFDLEAEVWNFDMDMDKTRVVTQYMFLITFLKFWHTLFIVGTWLVSVMFYIQAPFVNQGMFAANKQNFFFLFGFAMLWMLFLYKAYSNYFSEYVYQWFFVNPWGLGLSKLNILVEPLWCLFE